MRKALAILVCALAACGKAQPSPGSGSGPVDPIDAGPVDAGPPDAGPSDAGEPDAGPVDAGPPDAGPPPTGPVGFRATHYDYRFDLATRDATSQVTLAVEQGGDCVTLPFRAPLFRDVLLDGEAPRSAEAGDGGLTVCDATGRGLRPGQSVILQVGTTVAQQTLGVSDVGYSEKNDRRGNPFSYLLSWVNECDRFGPCDNRPEVFATYHFTVLHPANTQVLCPGAVTADAGVTECDFPFAGGPTYSGFGFYASETWMRSDLGSFDGVRLTLFHGPTDGVLTSLDPTLVGGALHWLAGQFGPYPYGSELRYATGPTYWSGFEHPGSILLNERLVGGASSYSDGLEHTALHELAHMWAGDQTTLADTYDFTWKESMAEYLTYVYEDQAIDAGIAQATAHAWKNWSARAAYYPVPLEKPALIDYYGDAYGPGPMVLFRQLEVRFGRATVLQALQSVLSTGQRSLSMEQLRAALEAATGEDLTGYFASWVYGTGAPAWLTGAVRVADLDGGSYSVGVDLSTHDGAPRACAFHVRLLGSSGEAYDVAFDAVADAGQPIDQLVAPGFAVSSSELDPLAECLIYAPGAHKAAAPRANPWHVP